MFKYFKKQNNNLKKGFSLVEMLVAVGIFMSIMTIAITSLISIIGANKKSQSIKSTIDSVTFAIENISRDMREGSDYSCLLAVGQNFQRDCFEGGVAVRYTIISDDNLTHEVTYSFNGSSTDSSLGILTKKIDNNDPVDLISKDSSVNITNMKFYVIGAENELLKNESRTQPRVIITASGLISVKGSDTSFNMQTSVSQRTRKY